MNFTRTQFNESGVSMRFAVKANLAAIQKVFGGVNADGYYDLESGYDGTEYTFNAGGEHPVSLYTRYGNWRVGAWSDADAHAFIAWCKTNGLDLEVC